MRRRCPKGSPKGIKWPCHDYRNEALVSNVLSTEYTEARLFTRGEEGTDSRLSTKPMHQEAKRSLLPWARVNSRLPVVKYRFGKARLVDERALTQVAPSFAILPRRSEQAALWTHTAQGTVRALARALAVLARCHCPNPTIKTKLQRASGS